MLSRFLHILSPDTKGAYKADCADALPSAKGKRNFHSVKCAAYWDMDGAKPYGKRTDEALRLSLHIFEGVLRDHASVATISMRREVRNMPRMPHCKTISQIYA